MDKLTKIMKQDFLIHLKAKWLKCSYCDGRMGQHFKVLLQRANLSPFSVFILQHMFFRPDFCWLFLEQSMSRAALGLCSKSFCVVG